RHVALVGETAGRGGLRQGRAAGDQAPRQADAALQLVGVRRQAGGAREGAQHLEAAQAAGVGQVGQRQRRRGVVVDQRAGSRDGGGRRAALACRAQFQRARQQRQQQRFGRRGGRARARRGGGGIEAPEAVGRGPVAYHGLAEFTPAGPAG